VSVAGLDVARQRSSDRWRVLVVDDNHDAATLLGDVLERLGCTARVVHDGASALELVPSFRPDIVLLDIGLPLMDGYEVARTLRHVDPERGMRLVAVTGYGQESDRVRSLEAGFDEHLVKPVALETIRALLERHREGRRAVVEPRSPE
jgi:CheY-like chemotaxis protein